MTDQEMEFRINKRMVERGIFLLIIIAFVVLYFLKGDVAPQENLSKNVTLLNQQLIDKENTITTLLKNLSDTQQRLIQIVEKPVVVNTTIPPVTTLSGKITYAWTVSGSIMTAAEYNADVLAGNKTKLAELTAERKASNDSAERSELQDAMDTIEDEIARLEDGDPRYQLTGVNVTIKNGKETSAAIDYALCWTSIECSKVVSRGTINVDSGEDLIESIPITIPTIVYIDKTAQILQISLKQDGSEVFKQTKSFS